MADSFFKHKWQKTLLIISGILVTAVLVTALCINSILAPKLSDKLKEAILKGTDSLYTITYSNLDLNVLKGKAILHNIAFKPDTAVYHRLKKHGTAPNNLYEFYVDRLVVSNAHPLEIYFKKKLNIGLITLNSPKIQISKYTKTPHTAKKKHDRTLYQKIAKTFKLVHIAEIALTDIHYRQKDYTGPKVATSELKDMDIKATNLLIDSATQTDTSRFLYCRDVFTHLKNYSSQSADGLYTFKVKSVTLSTQTKKLTVTGLSLIPVAIKTFFAKSKADRFTVQLQSLVLDNFDYSIFEKTQSIDIKKLILDKGYFEVTSNYNGALPTTDRIVTFPHWATRNQLKMPFNVDTVAIRHMTFVYSELNKKPNKFGHIKFNNINGNIRNVTNRKDLLKTNNLAVANISSYFLGKARLDLQFVFNLSSDTYNYAYKGHLAPMNLTDVNPVLMPLSTVKITSGRLKSFDFNIHSTQQVSKGTVSFLYHDLNVDILRADYSKNSLLSILANTVIIKHDNPDDGAKTPRLANVVYIRPKSFPFFKTVWNVLLNGIKSGAGIGPAQEKKLSQQNETVDKKEQEKIIKKAVKDKEKADKDFKKKLEDKKKN